MGRELQKKKNRSAISKAKPKLNNRTKSGRKKVNFLGNVTIAKNWDRKQTLTQNYKRLGLSAKLRGPTGGTERTAKKGDEETTSQDPFAIVRPANAGKFQPEEVHVERDPETGKILKILSTTTSSKENDNPLNDPLNDIMDVVEEPIKNSRNNPSSVVAALEAQAREEAEQEAKKKRPRQQSTREEEWIEKLVEKYGDDTAKMVRDKKLNPMQQTEADIKRRLKKWKAKHANAVSS